MTAAVYCFVVAGMHCAHEVLGTTLATIGHVGCASTAQRCVGELSELHAPLFASPSQLCHTHPFLLVVTELCAGGDLQSVLHLPEVGGLLTGCMRAA